MPALNDLKLRLVLSSNFSNLLLIYKYLNPRKLRFNAYVWHCFVEILLLPEACPLPLLSSSLWSYYTCVKTSIAVEREHNVFQSQGVPCGQSRHAWCNEANGLVVVMLPLLQGAMMDRLL